MKEAVEKFPVFPEIEPYDSEERYGFMKEDFKTILNKLDQLVEEDKNYRVIDIGCANGELLYLLHQQYPQWELKGVDMIDDFINTAKNFNGLKDVEFDCADFFEVTGEYDIVLSTCVLIGYQAIQEPLEKMISLCRDGGHLLATGLFNPYDINVKVEFCNNENEATRGTWTTDFNRHSRASIRRMFGEDVRSIEFEQCPFNVSIDHDPDHPARVWTIQDEDGNYILTNGAGQILNQTLMTIQK